MNSQKNCKHAGGSLVITFVTSLFVSGITIFMLSQTLSLVEKTSSLERSSHYFFASESAIENALFHKNSRGTGWESSDNSIAHDEISATSKWKISALSESFSGELYPSTNIEIPFYWDGSDINVDKDIAEISGQNLDFSVTFKKIEGLGNIITGNNRPIIDWDLSRTIGKQLQKFIPNRSCTSGESGQSTTICTNDLNNRYTANFVLEISGNTILNGKISPGNTDTNLKNFLSENSANQFKFSLRSLFPLQKEDPTGNINYISPAKFEFKNKNGSTNPQQFYTINSSVTLPDFIQDLSIKVAEKTSIGVFNYSILGE